MKWTLKASSTSVSYNGLELTASYCSLPRIHRSQVRYGSIFSLLILLPVAQDGPSY